ncbi:NAD-binding Rossmann fold oxidoreductase family [Fusarium albosuccineum]|uniref:NAD-binding Rossmann fold oxidoreductase family n=1 Tax=Fusarium albosuccineum TaxID=1237068 RepID=A0A8H4LMJ1_9HYPO|nr:NAD-binding Rossmann fold oxidoreductase family [Fusarium albosuccineum]
MPINVALVGGGIWAREEHLPAIVASKDLALKAVYSRTNKSASSIADNVSYPLDLYTDEDGKGFDALLERTDIEAVVLSLPIKNQHSLVVPEGKFYQTEWRKNPTHQGGFLLDGGVHCIAGIRQLLAAQDGNQVAQVSAFTTLLRDHLPPVDTAHAIFKALSGATGSFQISVGSSSKADEWTVECEHGWVKINGHGGSSEVTVSKDGQVTTETIQNEKTGVPPEIRAWGEALVAGRVDEEQEPEAALADLELIELLLKSGDNHGATMDCVHQDV